MGSEQRTGGGRRGLDPQRRTQVTAWGEEVRARIDQRRDVADDSDRLDVKRLAKDLGVARSTLITWLMGETAPDPWVLARLEEELSFPLDEQLELLGWRPAASVPASDAGVGNVASSADQMSAPVRLPMITQLRRAIDELAEVSARVSDLSQGAGDQVVHPASRLVDAVLAGGNDRWEVRSQPYLDGVRYPLPRETFVEFGLRDDVEPLTWGELERRYAGFLRERAPDAYARTSDDDPVRDRIKRERLELRAILDEAGESRRMEGTFFGEAGTRWVSVSRLTKAVGDRRWTHLFGMTATQSSAAATDHSLLSDTAVSTLLVIAPAYGTATFVGGLLARALGWREVVHDRITTAAWGRPRDGVAGERLRQLGLTLSDWLQVPPPYPSVFSVVRHHVIQRQPELASLALQSPSVLTVVVTPTDAVLQAWEQQQFDNAAFVGKPALGTFDEMTAANAALLAAFPASAPRVLHLPFHVDGIEPVSIERFRDRRLHDEQVRVAERLRRQLGASARDGSELHRFSERLTKDEDLER
jgi:hypothetical protein